MTRPVLLVVEDDAGLARQLRWAYEAYEGVVAGDRAAALDAIAARRRRLPTQRRRATPMPSSSA